VYPVIALLSSSRRTRSCTEAGQADKSSKLGVGRACVVLQGGDQNAIDGIHADLPWGPVHFPYAFRHIL